MKIFIFPILFLAFIFYLTVQGCASSQSSEKAAQKNERRPATMSAKYAPQERNYRLMREHPTR